MKIVMLSADPVDSHGWGRYACDLITALGAENRAITLITSTRAPENPGLPVTAYHRILPSVTASPPERAIRLRLLLLQHRVKQLAQGADVIHVLAEPYTLAAGGLSPLVVTAHGTYIPRTAQDPAFGPLYRDIYRHAAITAVSRYTAEQVRAQLPDAAVSVIANGVVAARFQAPARPVEKHGWVILAVGQMKARKGFHILCQAMPRIRAAHPTAEAVLIGSTPDAAYLQAIRDQLEADHLTGAVHILGRVDDQTMLDWYHGADVFALPALNVDGRFEGFGLVYLEASAAGLPVVGTTGCGAEEAILDGETGWLVPQNDPDALAEAIIRLLGDPSLRAKMGAAGVVHAQANDWHQVAHRVSEFYALVRTSPGL
ncbi:MAG TPA: glycosyltransferase family 4 protein [Aggregatilineales bacterium]|nr:glycosyltransferase family 4 protein [Aggregatilineales bacterium]